jgi:ABC-type transporter Mla subunit MlaD
MAEITIRVSDKALKAAGVLGVLLGAVFLLWSSPNFDRRVCSDPKYQIQMFVPESAGAQVGAPVRLDGMPVGSVSVVSPLNSKGLEGYENHPSPGRRMPNGL